VRYYYNQYPVVSLLRRSTTGYKLSSLRLEEPPKTTSSIIYDALFNQKVFFKTKMKFLLYILALLGASAGYSQTQTRFTAAVDARAEAILSKMSADEKIAYIGGKPSWYIRPVERLGVPQITMSDSPQGVGNAWTSTAYPAVQLLAATWNTEMAFRYGEAIGRDARARGINIMLGPAVNIYRSPLCGRNFEYMGEDPFLAGEIAAAYIRGEQGQGVMSTVKHFAANNSETHRTLTSSEVDMRALHEIYLPAFKAAVQEGGVGAIMTSYNKINGVYSSDNPWLLKELLRDEWGFKGLVMSDWGATGHCELVSTVKNGLDLEMPSGKLMNPKDIKASLKKGDITMDMIDVKVRNILRTIIAFGFLDSGHVQKDAGIAEDDPQNVRAAQAVAEEGLVLLKNNGGVLPVNPAKVRTIAVVERNATLNVHGGGSGSVRPYHYVSLLDGMEKMGEKYNIKVEHVSPDDFMPPLLFTSPDKSQKGLTGYYFDNRDLKGKPKGVRVDANINFSWNKGPGIKGVKGNDFSVRWTGYICPGRDGDYIFKAGADDGYRLAIGGETLLDDWREGTFRTSTRRLRLEAGKVYPVKLEYFQAGGDAVVEFSWSRAEDGDGAVRAAYIDALNKADLVVAYFGFDSDTEHEGADRAFALPAREREALQATLSTTTPVVGVLTSGGSVDMREWEPKLRGLLWACYPGQEGGAAIARVLFGEVNPSGRLPVTFEKRLEDNPAYGNFAEKNNNRLVPYKEGIFVGYRGFDKLKRDVRYPFGYGLSYTTFALSDMAARDLPGGGIEVSFTLANTGKAAGAQVVQLYVNKGNKYVENPEKELKGFKKIFLEPGRSQTASIVITPDAFSWYDTKAGRFVTKHGDYDVMLGFSSRDIKAAKKVAIR